MLEGSGCCPVSRLLKENVPVGLGVDGSASNNLSNMLHEMRNAFLVQRAFYGNDGLTPTQVLEIAILGGARVLGRKDIGILVPGKAADLIAINLQKVFFSGALHDPVTALVLCTPYQVDFTMVNGKIVVSEGRVVHPDMSDIIKRHNKAAHAIVERTEKRYGLDLSSLTWKRAFFQERGELTR
jgi:cytosine/adenosine deaminase-related metal-dependent hydrolase